MKAVIQNDAGEVLCVKEDSDLWELPGGGMDHGETVYEALKRELYEEIAYGGDFTYKFIDTVTMYNGAKEMCVMLIAFEVELLEDYEPRAGSDIQLIEWIDPVDLAEEEGRATRAIVKFAHNPAHEVLFKR